MKMTICEAIEIEKVPNSLNRDKCLKIHDSWHVIISPYKTPMNWLEINPNVKTNSK
jgi:hypothetical protein